MHERLKQMSETNWPRWNASQALAKGVISGGMEAFFSRRKVPDLIGVADRSTWTTPARHLNRGIGDLMRYAALVSYAESSGFGPHQMLAAEQRKISGRLPDEAFYALALYIQSLKPPPNPNAFDERAHAGQQIFEAKVVPGATLRACTRITSSPSPKDSCPLPARRRHST